MEIKVNSSIEIEGFAQFIVEKLEGRIIIYDVLCDSYEFLNICIYYKFMKYFLLFDIGLK